MAKNIIDKEHPNDENRSLFEPYEPYEPWELTPKGKI